MRRVVSVAAICVSDTAQASPATQEKPLLAAKKLRFSSADASALGMAFRDEKKVFLGTNYERFLMWNWVGRRVF
jgi:hypothetical protein